MNEGPRPPRAFFRRTASIAAVVTALLAAGATDAAEPKAQSIKPDAAPGPRLIVPVLDAARGRQLFVTKGCVVCHSAPIFAPA